MKRHLLASLALMGLLSGGFLLLGETDARPLTGDVDEEWVDANHLRVRVNGSWQDVPLMPLADHMCQNENRLFKRYCSDHVSED